MGRVTPLDQRFFSRVAIFILSTALFAIAYAQSPLYTSNQNQYFLHGFARAGQGYLQNDWLANTTDPTPIFSFLVFFTVRFLQFETLFYIYYALLMGVYLYCLVGIVKIFTPNILPELKFLWVTVLVSLLICLHSAALRFVLSRTLGINWSYVLEDGVADQRILGPVFQPSTFGVFLVASIYLFADHRPYLAVIAAVLASVVHPTYLLSAGTLTLSYVLITLLHEKNIRQSVLLGSTALLCVAPILAYSFTNFIGDPSQNAAEARAILLDYRIPHHAVINQWFDSTVIVKLLIVFVGLYMLRRSRRLYLTMLASTFIAIILTIIQAATGNPFLALLFPWRLSIYIVPISTTIILVVMLFRLFSSRFFLYRPWSNLIAILSWTFALLAVVVGVIRFNLDLQRKQSAPERKIESYIYTHKSAGDIYLIPIKMQDFRLRTGAPAYIDFKSIPYKDQDVLEWYRRVRLADDIYISQDCFLLKNTYIDQVTHLVAGRDSSLNQCLDLDLLYQDEYYSVYRISISTSMTDNALN